MDSRFIASMVLAITLSLGMSQVAFGQGLPVPEKAPKDKPAPEATPKKEKGWLGVSLKATTPEKAKALGFDYPLVVIDMIFEGSPAFASNLKPGDLFVSVDTTVIKEVPQLVKLVGSHAAGDKIKLSMIRDGKKFEVPILLGIKPSRVGMLKGRFLNKPAPAFAVKSPKGDTAHETNALKGKVVVVDFWATWCGPCRKAMPHLNDLSERHKKDGLVVLGITDEEQKEVETFTGKNKVLYPLALDPGRTVHRDYMISALPTLFIIDHEGVVRDVLIGGGSKNLAALDASVARLLDARNKAQKP